MTSNALLLTPEIAKSLVTAGLDQFTVSIDGVTDDSHGVVRPGASLAAIKTNVGRLYGLSEAVRETPLRIGIEFVAMRQNIRELPMLREVAYAVRASFILVSNLLPYTAAMQDDILYRLGPMTSESQGSPEDPLWMLPHLDWSQETQESLTLLMRQQPRWNFLDLNLTQRNNHCPFIQAGSLAVAWHGGVSPCPPLLHSYRCFIRGREKAFRHCEFGRLTDESLLAIWRHPDYAAFRERVRQFEFSPCTDCGGCDLAETNEEDCFGNPFPVCGDCLWARGVLRCA